MDSFDKLLKHHLFNEAISLKNIRKRKLTKKNSGAYGNDKLDNLFGNKNRLISPILIDYTTLVTDHLLFRDIKSFLHQHSFGIPTEKDYIDGLAYKRINPQGEQGVYDLKNPMKIGKLLQKYEKDGEIEVTHRVDGRKTTKKIVGKPLLHEFKNDPIRSTNGELLMVISRHPYDISGASTDRSWTSCMDLGLPRINYPKTKQKEGINKKHIPKDIQHGTLVAYVVTKDELYKGPNGDDKVRLQRPLSRILMKPHNSDSGSVYSMGPLYGSKYPEFKQKVEEWIMTNLNHKAKSGDRTYQNRELYNDGDTPVGFKFNGGNDIAEKAMNEVLGWNNEKALGGDLTFTSSGNQLVEYVISADFTFPADIVRPFDELNDFSPYDLKSIHSPIERSLALAVANSMRINKNNRRSDFHPRISMGSNGDGINLEIVFEIQVYSDEDKHVDDDTISDVLEYGLEPFKDFNFQELRKELYVICRDYDWDNHENEQKSILDAAIKSYKQLLNIIAQSFPGISILSKLVPMSPAKLLTMGYDYMKSYTQDLTKIKQEFTSIENATRMMEQSLSYKLRSSEQYTDAKHQIFYTWVKDVFGVDLVKCKSLLGQDGGWGLHSIYTLKDSKAPPEDIHNVMDVRSEIIHINSHIKTNIGYMGEVKI